MRRPATPTLPLALCALLCASPAGADEVTDQIDSARGAYSQGDLRQAVQGLQDAIVRIQEKLQGNYGALMPEPLAGWRAEAAESQTLGMAMLGGGTQVSRRYLKEDTGESVQVQIMADSPFLPMMAMVLSNPMMIQSDPSTKLYRHGAYRGTLKHEAGSDQWEISLLVANRILVQVEGQGLKGPEAVEGYLKAIDLQAVEKAFAS